MLCDESPQILVTQSNHHLPGHTHLQVGRAWLIQAGLPPASPVRSADEGWLGFTSLGAASDTPGTPAVGRCAQEARPGFSHGQSKALREHAGEGKASGGPGFDWHGTASSVFYWPKRVAGQPGFNEQANKGHLLREGAVSKGMEAWIQQGLDKIGCIFCNLTKPHPQNFQIFQTPLWPEGLTHQVSLQQKLTRSPTFGQITVLEAPIVQPPLSSSPIPLAIPHHCSASVDSQLPHGPWKRARRLANTY